MVREKLRIFGRIFIPVMFCHEICHVAIFHDKSCQKCDIQKSKELGLEMIKLTSTIKREESDNENLKKTMWYHLSIERPVVGYYAEQ